MHLSLETNIADHSKEEALLIIAQAYEEKLDYNQLLDFYRTYFKSTFHQFSDRFDFESVKRTQILRKNPRKSEATAIVARCYWEQELFSRVFHSLSKKLQAQMYDLVWYGSMSLFEFSRRFGLNLDKRRNSYSITVPHDLLLFFWVDNSYYNMELNKTTIFLPRLIRSLLKRHLKKPEGYHLTPVEEPKPCRFMEIYGGDLQTQTLCYQFVEQGELAFSKSGEAVLKSSLKKMAGFAGVIEYFDGSLKKDSHLKTWLTALLLDCFIHQIEDGPPVARVKKLFDLYFETEDFQLIKLLPHLKKSFEHFMREPLEEYNLTVMSSFKQLLQLMPVNRWVKFEDLVILVYFREINLFFISPEGLNASFYIRSYRGYWAGRENLSLANMDRLFIRPFLQINMFLFAAFGLVDLAYDLPEVDTDYMDGEYITPCKGLRYTRLTDLGAYIFGLEKEFNSQLETVATARVIPDEDGLFLTLTGEDKLKRFLLEKIAEPISANRYKVSFASFLAGVQDETQVTERINMFFEKICEKPPANWQAFFEQLTKRIDPVKTAADWCVFKVAPDRELLSLLLMEPKLRKYLLKAENYHLLIRADKVNRVKKYLSDMGYVLPSMIRP